MQVRLKTSSWLSWTGNLNISFVHLSSNDNLTFFVTIFIDNFKIYWSFSRVMASITGVAKEYTDPLLARGVLCLWTISICLPRKSMVPNLQLNCWDRWDENAILKTRLELYLIIFPSTLAKSHCNVHFYALFHSCRTRGSLSKVVSCHSLMGRLLWKLCIYFSCYLRRLFVEVIYQMFFLVDWSFSLVRSEGYIQAGAHGYGRFSFTDIQTFSPNQLVTCAFRT